MKWTHSLRTKLILIICAILLPVNLLLLFLSQRLLNHVQQQLMSAYENELAIYMTRVDDGLSDITRKLNELMAENWKELNPSASDYEVKRYSLWKELKSAREELELADCAYLKTNEDSWTAATYNSAVMGVHEVDILKEYISTQDMDKYESYQFHVTDIQTEKYLIINVNYYNYSFGMAAKVSSIVDGMDYIQNNDKDQLLLTDDKGTILSEAGISKIETVKKRQKLDIDEHVSEYLVIPYPFEYLDNIMVRLVPMEELENAIPQMERGIQIACIFSVLLIPLMFVSIQKLVLIPLNKLNQGMHEIERENLDYRLREENSSREFLHVGHVFNHMAEQIQNLKIQSYEKDIEKLKIETTNLRLQINPHLLLNSLNMVYSLAQSKNYECILSYTLHLVEYFRYSLRQNDELVPISAEMNFVKNFLEIQKIRFPDAFTSVYNMEDILHDVLVPPLLIQNFVENSIKYALKMGDTIEIIIIVKSMADKLCISVIDTGNGMPEGILEILRRGEPVKDRIGTHIGIWNCRRRLSIFYKEKAVLSISSKENEGTQVWMELPIQRKTGGGQHEIIDC